MAINFSESYIQNRIPSEFVCNEIVPAKVMTAPRVRCRLKAGHKNHHHGYTELVEVTWNWGYSNIVFSNYNFIRLAI